MLKERLESCQQAWARFANFGEVRYETSGQNPTAYKLTEPFLEVFAVLNNLQINGAELLPREGPAIFGLIHTHWRDLFYLQWLPTVTVGRTVRTFCRASLLSLDIQEVAEAQATRTQKSFMTDHSKAGILAPLARRGRLAFADYLRCFDIIPVEPHNPFSRINARAIRTVDEELRNGHLIAAFVTPHRKPRLDLLESQRGVDLMMKRHPDVPFYPIAFSGLDKLLGQWTINIGHPFTYRKLMDKDINSDRVMDFIVDQIAEQVVDPDLIPAWRLNRQGGYPREQIELLAKHHNLAYVARVVLGDRPWRQAA